MRGKRFWSVAGLLALMISAGCHTWCDHHYPCQERGYAAAAPAPACVPCAPCCPAPVAPVPVAAVPPPAPRCCP